MTQLIEQADGRKSYNFDVAKFKALSIIQEGDDLHEKSNLPNEQVGGQELPSEHSDLSLIDNQLA